MMPQAVLAAAAAALRSPLAPAPPRPGSRAVCFCLHGTPAHLRDPEAAARYVQQAHQAWAMWRDPATALGQHDAIEVLVSGGGGS